MSKPVTIPNIFANQVGPIPLSQLDADLAVGATALNDFLTYTNGVTDTGVVNALVITILAPLTFAYTLFVALDVQVSNTTTSTAPTINVNSLGAKTITANDGGALSVGALVSGGIYRLLYDGTNFRVQGLAGAALFANPTASVGLAAVNGSATTAMRSDGAPALSQSIAPTWTGAHIFQGNAVIDRPASSAGYGILELDDQTGTRKFQAVFVGSTAGSVYGATAGNVVLDTPGSVSMTLSTADSARVVIGSAGNVTVNAPSSGVPLTATGGSPNANAVFNSSGVLGGWIAFQSNGADTSYWGSGNRVFSSTVNDVGITSLGANRLQLGTNSLARIDIAGAGNVTVNAPSSGSALTVSGLANVFTQVINASVTANQSFGMQLNAGTSASDTALAVKNQASTVSYFVVRGDGAISGLGPVAGALVDMTPDTGTFTGTATGMTAGVSYSCTWTRHGKLVTLAIGGSTGTSNSTSFTMTGLPAAIQPASVTPRIQMNGAIMQDNGATVGTSAITEASLAASSGTITFLKGGLSTGWTAANSKGIPTGATAVFSYLLN